MQKGEDKNLSPEAIAVINSEKTGRIVMYFFIFVMI
jgi:hypothetical protein